MAKILLEMKNITKTFPGVKALDNVNLQVEEGEIHALVGENGAGKSTLIKIIASIYKPTRGEVILDGKVCNFKTPKDALDAGIAVIEQETAIAPHLTVAENMYLGCEPKKANGLLDRKKMEADAQAVLDEMGLDVDAHTLCSKLTAAQLQMVEIAKVISKHAKVVVLDEPTSYLDIRYKLEFMSVLQELARRKKVAVILSIHELDLAERVSDWVLCVSPGQESQFGRPEEMLTPEHLSELFQVEEGRFRQTGGSMELPRPEGAPEVFVLAGGGSGRAVFWQLQRAGTTFAAGIVSEADLDYPAACTLASRLIAVPAFEEISEEKEQEARECLDACQCVIACRRQYGGWAAANDRLLAYAREKGKKIEYHNLPLHKMQ